MTSFQGVVCYHSNDCLSFKENDIGYKCYIDMLKVVQVNLSIAEPFFVMNMNNFSICSTPISTLCIFKVRNQNNLFINVSVLNIVYTGPTIHRRLYGGVSVINPFSDTTKIIQQFHYQSLCSNYSQVLSHNSHIAPPIAVDRSDVFIVFSYRKYSSISVQLQINSMSSQPVTMDSIEKFKAVMISTKHAVGASNWRFKMFKTVDGYSHLIVPKTAPIEANVLVLYSVGCKKIYNITLETQIIMLFFHTTLISMF